MVLGHVQWMVLVKVARIEKVQILGHVLAEVWGFNTATEGIGVGKEDDAFVAIFGFKVIMIKLVHY